ncbi:MAG: hypothetical protein ACAI34_09430, partial [Verrucomicrobium sp.]|nr:hypothetical protein [Verrucomicrobium sp.]
MVCTSQTLKLSFLAGLIFMLGGIGLRAQTVADFFLLLPDAPLARWGEIQTPLTVDLRKRLVSAEAKVQEKARTEAMIREMSVDPKNGYLTFVSPGDGEGMNVYMTYWREKKKKDGPCVIAVVTDKWSAATHTSCGVYFYRWTPESPKTLEDVSAQYLPALHAGNFYETTKEAADLAEKAGLRWIWELPQKGTTIRIKGAQVGDDIYDK